MVALHAVLCASRSRLPRASTEGMQSPRCRPREAPGAPRRSRPSSVRCASVVRTTRPLQALDLPEEQDSEDELEREDGTQIAPTPGSEEDEPDTPSKDGSIEDDDGERF